MLVVQSSCMRLLAGSTWTGGIDLPAAARLTREEIRVCKADALRRVRVPQHVIQLVTDLRSYLQVRSVLN